MKCKRCGKELTDFNEFSKNDPKQKEIGHRYRKEDDGMVFFCNDKACKNYHKMLVKGFDFGRKSYWHSFLHTLCRLSTKGR